MKRVVEGPHCYDCMTRKKSLLHNLAIENLEELDDLKTCQIYKKGEVVFHEGGIPHGVFCVSKGKMKVFKTGFDGRDQIIRFAQEGDMLGYRSLLSNEKYNVTVTCIEDSSICFIPKETVLKLISENNVLALNIMKAACLELGEATRLITNLAQKSIKERLAEVLLILQSNFGLDENNAIQVVLTREEIASMVGTATESVIRMLSDFDKEGIIELKGKQIMLIDNKKLVEIAGIND